MALWDIFFGKKSRLSEIEKMSASDLEKEQLRLEAQQDAIISRVKTLEKRKKAALSEGARKKSNLERKAMAVRYKQLDAEASDYVSQASLLSKHIRVVGRICQLKRREALLKQEGLWSIISDVEPAELEQFMIEMRTKALQGDREASRLMEILEEPTGEAAEEEDGDLQTILDAMDTIGESDLSDEEFEQLEEKLHQAEEEDDV